MLNDPIYSVDESLRRRLVPTFREIASGVTGVSTVTDGANMLALKVSGGWKQSVRKGRPVTDIFASSMAQGGADNPNLEKAAIHTIASRKYRLLAALHDSDTTDLYLPGRSSFSRFRALYGLERLLSGPHLLEAGPGSLNGDGVDLDANLADPAYVQAAFHLLDGPAVVMKVLLALSSESLAEGDAGRASEYKSKCDKILSYAFEVRTIVSLATSRQLDVS